VRKFARRGSGGGGRDFNHSARFIASVVGSEFSGVTVSPSAENARIVSAAARAIRSKNLPEG
jgi:hypothetical protein